MEELPTEVQPPRWRHVAPQMAGAAALLAGLLWFCVGTSQGRTWSGHQPRGPGVGRGTMNMCGPVSEGEVPQRFPVSVTDLTGARPGDHLEVCASSPEAGASWCVGSRTLANEGPDLSVLCDLGGLSGPLVLRADLRRDGKVICTAPQQVIVHVSVSATR